MAKKRTVMEVSNLSIHNKKFIRTGIQEVVYKTLLNLIELRQSVQDQELILLPHMPRRFGNLLTGMTTVPFQSPAPSILEGIEDQFRISSRDIWGFDLKRKDYRLSDEESLHWIAGAEALHIQSMVNIGPLMENLKNLKGPRPVRLSMTIYDLSPVLFPEYCDYGLSRWFGGVYLPSICRHADHAICISHHTARDLSENSITEKIPRISVLPPPFELASAREESNGSSSKNSEKKEEIVLKKMAVRSSEYLIFLGSLEPRKNFEALLAGFECYLRLSPNSPLKLMIVGATGWKNDRVEKLIRISPARDRIVRTGYLSDQDLEVLIRHSLALAMVSHYEGFGLPIAQAHSLGTPVITTLGSSLPEACGGEGIFVEPHDPFSICAGIQVAQRMDRSQQLPSHSSGLRKRTWKNYTRELMGLIDVPLVV